MAQLLFKRGQATSKNGTVVNMARKHTMPPNAGLSDDDGPPPKSRLLSILNRNVMKTKAETQNQQQQPRKFDFRLPNKEADMQHPAAAAKQNCFSVAALNNKQPLPPTAIVDDHDKEKENKPAMAVKSQNQKPSKPNPKPKKRPSKQPKVQENYRKCTRCTQPYASSSTRLPKIVCHESEGIFCATCADELVSTNAKCPFCGNHEAKPTLSRMLMNMLGLDLEYPVAAIDLEQQRRDAQRKQINNLSTLISKLEHAKDILAKTTETHPLPPEAISLIEIMENFNAQLDKTTPGSGNGSTFDQIVIKSPPFKLGSDLILFVAISKQKFLAAEKIESNSINYQTFDANGQVFNQGKANNFKANTILSMFKDNELVFYLPKKNLIKTFSEKPSDEIGPFQSENSTQPFYVSTPCVEVVSLAAEIVCIREANHLVRVFNRLTGICLCTVTSNECERLRVDKRGRLVVVNTATSRVKVVKLNFANGPNEIVHEFQFDQVDSSTPNQFISITEQNEIAFASNGGSIITFYKLE